jgi:hypothetical protein
MLGMTDREFLNFIADRLVHLYGNRENADFVLRLREIAEKGTAHVHDMWECSECMDMYNEGDASVRYSL